MISRCVVNELSAAPNSLGTMRLTWRTHLYDELDMPMMGTGANMSSDDEPEAAPILADVLAYATQIVSEWDEYLADGQAFRLRHVDARHYSPGERPGYGIAVDYARDGDPYAGQILLAHYDLDSPLLYNNRWPIGEKSILAEVDARCAELLARLAEVSLPANRARGLERRRITKFTRLIETERKRRERA